MKTGLKRYVALVIHLMRSLYWKIFLSFWLATILIILTTAWITSEIAKSSSIPERERLFMDSYANAAVMTFESSSPKALSQWLEKTGKDKEMNLYLLTSTGQIFGEGEPPNIVKQIGSHLVHNRLDEGLLKSGNIFVSHEILSTSGVAYRLAAVSEKPLSHFVRIPWAGLTLRLIIAILISGLICYLLSRYLTKPLRSLRQTARSLAKGHLHARVGPLTGHQTDEIAELSVEFDEMAAKLQFLLQSKDRLLQDISHELRSPLARLQVAIELARQKTEQKAKHEFNRMEIETVRLNKLIGEILEFSRLEHSDKLSKSKVNLASLLEQITQDANFEFSHTTPRVKMETLQPCHTNIDERLIHRAVENVLRNALRYSPDDQPVFVALHIHSDDKEVHIEIKDHGPGIPEDEVKHVFSPFYRLDSAREERTGGFGLGLAIAQQAISLHGGRIQIKNRRTSGLQVDIILPLH